MEYIKITRVDNVILHRRGRSVKGTLHLTTHHLIFTMPAPPPPPPQNGSNAQPQTSVANRELWLCYPMIEKLDFNKGSAMLFKEHYSGVSHSDNIETGSVYTENSNNSNNGKSGIDKNQQLKLQDRNTTTTNIQNDSINKNNNNGISKENGLNIYDKSYLRGSNLRFCCKDFTYLAFDFEDFNKGKAVFDSVMRLCCLDTIEKVYAFIYSPVRIELPFNSWKDYNILNEFERQGLIFQSALQNSRNSGNLRNGIDLNGKLGQTRWRITNLNKDYKLCPSYPSTLIVPRIISDSVLGHSVRFRSKNRFPALSYYYKKNGCTITRCAQPLVGIKQNRSFQDEKLLNEIFKTNNNVNYDNNDNDNDNNMTTKRNRKFNLIVDCRPLSNAVAQTALGAGTEIMDNYDDCKKIFLNIDNIHVIRDSLNKVREVLKNGDISTNLYNKELLYKSNWLKHISTILSGVDILVKSMVLNNNHLLIHCSDGWDRTTQISSLVQICLDPYYRTINGFVILIEKEWLSFGHRFNERCGHLQNETKFHDNIENLNSNQATQAFRQVTNHFKHKKSVKFVSPIFQQFLDCIYQLIRQYPNKFEYNERFLRRLVYHLYSCQYGTFLFDCERERNEHDIQTKTRSVWDYFKSRKFEFSNPNYIKEDDFVAVDDNDNDDDDKIIYPKVKDVKFWFQLFGKSDSELNYSPYGFENSGEFNDSNLDSSSSNSAITKSKDINSNGNGIINGNGNGGTAGISNSIGDLNTEESLIDTSIITKNVENVFDILKQSTADVFSQFTNSVNGVTNNISNSLSDSINDIEKSQELKETKKSSEESQDEELQKKQQHEAIIHSVPAKALIALEERDEDEDEESGDKEGICSDDKESSDSDTTIKNVDNNDIKKIVSEDDNNDSDNNDNDDEEREKELARRLSEFEISTEEDEIALENQLRNN
ncbi:hypothetical protein B5S31_g5227 [[Candida] boidinii]|nr:hypothetical protein B5S31_g5227 [[Candida] boidinii]